MSKHLTPEQWAKLYPAAWRALCEQRAAVMPIDPKVKNYDQRPTQVISRSLVFRLDAKL